MSFMSAEITDYQEWHKIDGACGIEFYPAEYFTIDQAAEEYSAAGEIWESETIWGYGARMSASGYLDCTDWCVFKTEIEARQYLDETYGNEAEEEEEEIEVTMDRAAPQLGDPGYNNA